METLFWNGLTSKHVSYSAWLRLKSLSLFGVLFATLLFFSYTIHSFNMVDYMLYLTFQPPRAFLFIQVIMIYDGRLNMAEDALCYNKAMNM
jgi:hypothetical protein